MTSLNRVRVYWREIVFNKIRFLLTVVFVTTLNIVTRLVSFTRQKPAAQFTSPIVTSSNHQKFEVSKWNFSKSIRDRRQNYFIISNSLTSDIKVYAERKERNTYLLRKFFLRHARVEFIQLKERAIRRNQSLFC